MSASTKPTTLALLDGMIAGLQQAGVLPKGFQFYSEEVSYTASGMLTKLTGLAQPMNQVTAARAAVKAAELAEAQAEAVAKKVLADARRDLMSFFSSDPSKLALFDIPVPKARTPLTAAKRLQKALKAAATREARGTKGRKARLAIKANPTPPTTVVVDDAGMHVVPATTASAAK